MNWFHSSAGWFWERTADGGVRVTKRKGWPPESAEVLEEHVLTGSEWASIVAHVSAVPCDTAARHQEALDYHNGGSK